jgi:glycosyltransferase involved in cell wall biosynthesis
MANVSVIIPLFNTEKYITRAIESVFSQTYQDFEIIVVDDDSTDGGPDLVQTYRDPRLRMIHQPNGGPGAARNRGIKETTTPYLAFLDADDEWLPDFLCRYLDALETNPDCDYVVGPYFEGDPQVDRSELWREFGVREGPWMMPLNVSHTDLHKFLTMLHWTCAMLCKRHVVEKYGGFYAKAKCKHGEDRYLQLQLLLNHKMYRMMDPLARYHTETIGLDSNRPKPRPVRPFLVDPEPIRENCPHPFREVLEQYLAWHALGTAWEYADVNNFSTSLSLMRRFPLMRKNRGKYIKLLFRVSLAQVTKCMFPAVVSE